MTLPILEAIDAALITHYPQGILASANEAVFHQVTQALPVGTSALGRVPYTVGEDTVWITRSLAQIPGGWSVRKNARFERPPPPPPAPPPPPEPEPEPEPGPEPMPEPTPEPEPEEPEQPEQPRDPETGRFLPYPEGA